ncbi:hypothetical protein H5410_040921 [Solanum commersonii]|uniref:Uncharacterized protein n=1 Tax=Solanum commersonii TaxID=4109 RepID=A0A9J5XS78_SOLCO|nr:hypothetical protein H5410_040921 [Solanum commersonii]
MGSSRTPTCRMKTRLHLTRLTLSSRVLGYGTRVHSLELNLILTYSLGHQSSSLVITNLCCSGSFGIISQNCPSTQRFSLRCSSSPSCIKFQHCLSLGHWAIQYFSHSGTKGIVRPFGDSPSGLGDPQFFISSFFSALFIPFLQRRNQEVFIRQSHTHKLSQICAAADRLALLVGIADKLSYSAFGVVHRHLVPTFSIVL